MPDITGTMVSCRACVSPRLSHADGHAEAGRCPTSRYGAVRYRWCNLASPARCGEDIKKNGRTSCFGQSWPPPRRRSLQHRRSRSSRLRCATWVRSISAAGTSRSRDSRSRRSCSRRAACRRRWIPNGTYQVEQMYSQYFLVQNRKGKLPLLMWHGGGLSGVTYETKPDGKPGWLNYFLRQGWDVYISDAMERGRSGWTNQFKGEARLPAARRSLGAFPDRPDRLVVAGPGEAQDLSGHAVSDRGLRAIHEAGRAALGDDRQGDRRRLYRAGRQGLSVRRHGAQPVRHVRLPGAGGAAGQGQGADRGRADGRRRPQQGRLDQVDARSP